MPVTHTTIKQMIQEGLTELKPTRTSWNDVDWVLRDTDIAPLRGCTREAVRQHRPTPSPFKWLSSTRISLKRFLTEHAAKISGLSLMEIVKLSGASRYLVRDVMDELELPVLPQGQSPHLPYESFAWELPNSDLAIAWETKSQLVANKRFIHLKGPPLWDSRRAEDKNNQHRINTLRREIQKAHSFFISSETTTV